MSTQRPLLPPGSTSIEEVWAEFHEEAPASSKAWVSYADALEFGSGPPPPRPELPPGCDVYYDGGFDTALPWVAQASNWATFATRGEAVAYCWEIFTKNTGTHREWVAYADALRERIEVN